MKKKNKPIKKIKLFLGIIFLILILLGSYIIKTGYDLYKTAITKNPIEIRIEELKSQKNYIQISEIPKTYQEAVIAVEDKRFYLHNGFDIISISRAVVTDIVTLSFSEGGSTITQQLAKNLYFTQEKKLSRKVAEVFLALKLEELYSKEDILEFYMNIIYYGDGYYGIGNASLGYFKKLPSELTLNEQTLLAGLPNAPAIYQLSNNSNLTYQRQEIVLETMAECGYITTEDIKNIKNNWYFNSVSVFLIIYLNP